MKTPYDLLQKQDDGSFIWLEAANNLDTAKIRLKELAVRSPGEFVVFDQKTHQMVERISHDVAVSSRVPHLG